MFAGQAEVYTKWSSFQYIIICLAWKDQARLSMSRRHKHSSLHFRSKSCMTMKDIENSKILQKEKLYAPREIMKQYKFQGKKSSVSDRQESLKTCPFRYDDNHCDLLRFMILRRCYLLAPYLITEASRLPILNVDIINDEFFFFVKNHFFINKQFLGFRFLISVSRNWNSPQAKFLRPNSEIFPRQT